MGTYLHTESPVWFVCNNQLHLCKQTHRNTQGLKHLREANFTHIFTLTNLSTTRQAVPSLTVRYEDGAVMVPESVFIATSRGPNSLEMSMSS